MPKSIYRLFAGLAAFAVIAGAAAAPARAQGAEPCIGQLMLFGGSYCPRNWVEADGGTLPISQNQALFSILSTTYGGDGRTTFGLPDLRGRAPISQGQGPGLPNYTQGQKTGQVQQRLTIDQMPAHSHDLNAFTGPGNLQTPNKTFFASTGGPSIYQSPTGTPDAKMAPATIGKTGSSEGFSIQNPVQVLRWCVAVQGIFCTRQ